MKMSNEERQRKLQELEKQYDDIIQQLDRLSDEFDDLDDDGSDEIMHDADIICAVYKKFIEAGMCEQGAYRMMRDLLGF